MDGLDLNLDGLAIAVHSVAITPERVAIVVASAVTQSICPRCGLPSGRVHSRYSRTLADLARQGRSVVLTIRARRFRCTAPDCPRAIFCERLHHLAAAHARVTVRLARV